MNSLTQTKVSTHTNKENKNVFDQWALTKKIVQRFHSIYVFT